MTAKKINFDADDQGNLARVAAEVVAPFMSFADRPVERLALQSLPRVPWFSNTGQQEAFGKRVEFFAQKVNCLNADERAKKGILFWVLALHFSNDKSFRLATASAKRPNAIILSPVARSFIAWAGQDIHPSLIVATCIDEWI